MNSRSYKRWFPNHSEEERAERDKAAGRMNAVQELVTREAYKTELREWLERMIRTNRPQPGPNETVNYSIGLQAGLQLVEDRLEALEREVRESNG